ncbi:FtsX-like permease family protein [Actinomycetes bacterium KLBMP 9797]
MRALLHRLRSTAPQLALLGALALTAALLVTGAPRLANHVADRALRDDIGRLSYAARDLRLTQQARLGTRLVPGTASDLEAYRERLPTPLPALVGEGWFASTVGPDRIETRVGNGPVTDIGLRSQTGVREAARLTSGRWPANRNDTSRVEVAVTAPVARQLGLAVDGVFTLKGAGQLDAIVVGVFEPVDRAAPVWAEMGVALEPFPGLPPDVPPQVVAVTDPAGIFAGQRLDAPAYSWRFRVDENRLNAGELDSVIAAVTQAQRQPPGLTRLDTTLAGALADFQGQFRAVQALLAIVQAGLLATLLGLVVLAASLAVERRRSEFALLRARGAAIASIGGRTLAESLVVVPAAVLVGWLAGRLAPGRPSDLEWLTVAVALLATLAVPVLAAVSQRQLTFVARRRDLVQHRPTPRRLIAELFVLVVAGLGAYLLRRRGLAPGDGVDPYLSAVPVLLAAAAAMLALRVFPWPLRQVGRLAARSRGAVAFLGLARAGRAGPVTAGPLAVLVIAITTGIFSGAVFTAVDDARDRAADRSVPADARLSGYLFAAGTEEKLAALPGVDAVAPAALAAGTTIQVDGAHKQGQALVVDGPKLAAVLARRDAGAELPAVLVTARPGGPVPAVVSRTLAAELGARGSVGVRSASYDFTVAAVVDELPGIAPGVDRFIALPWQAIPTAASPLLPNEFFVAGTGFDPAALAAAADEGQRKYATTVGMSPPPVTVTTWAGHRAALDRTGANDVLSFAFLTGTTGGTLLALLAVGFTVLAGAAQRGRVLSRLRTLGLSARQGRGLLVYELVPLATIAVLAGGVVGMLLPALLGPALGLSSFTSGAAVRTYLDPLVVGAVLALVVFVLAAAVLIENLINRRLRLGEVLRVGEESS